MARTAKKEPAIADVGIFKDLSKRDLKSIERLMTAVSVVAGKELIAEGAPGREFVVIVSGTAVVRKNGRKVAELGPGDFLGEIAVLTGATRNASVTAKTDMTLEVLNRREFMALLDESPKVMKKVLLAALKRLSEADKNPTS